MWDLETFLAKEDVDNPVKLLRLLHDYENFPKVRLFGFMRRDHENLKFDIEEIKELIRVITEFPSEDSSFDRCSGYPFFAVEIITEVYPGIIDRIATEKILMDFLFDFLNNGPYHTILAEYFSKVVLVLIRKHTKPVIEYMSSRGYLVILTNNVCIKAFCKIITNILNVVNDEPYFCLTERITLVKSAIAQFENSDGSTLYYLPGVILTLIRSEDGEEKSKEVNSWKSLVSAILANSSLDILISSLKSQDIEKSIASLKILAEIMASSVYSRLATPNPDDSDIFIGDESEFLLRIAESIPSLVNKLNYENHGLQRTQNKVLIKTISEARLIIIDFIIVCVNKNTPCIDKMLVETKAFNIIIDFFFEFQFCSMLHGLVLKMISAIVTTRLGSDLVPELFCTGLTEKLIRTNQNSLNYGHVIAISNVLIEAGKINEVVKYSLNSVAGWQGYVDTVLQNKNEIMSKVWGHLKTSDEQPKKRDAVAMLNRLIKKTPFIKKASPQGELTGKDDYISNEGSQDSDTIIDNTEINLSGKALINLPEKILIESRQSLLNMHTQPEANLLSNPFLNQATQNDQYWRFGYN